MPKCLTKEELEKFYPPQEFCKLHCKNGAIEKIIEYEDSGRIKWMISEDSKPSANKTFYNNISMFRISVGCDHCESAKKYMIQQEINKDLVIKFGIDPSKLKIR
jgi:hypothetical protein